MFFVFHFEGVLWATIKTPTGHSTTHSLLSFFAQADKRPRHVYHPLLLLHGRVLFFRLQMQEGQCGLLCELPTTQCAELAA